MSGKPEYETYDLLIRSDLWADDFNDDTVGRSLDDLNESGVTEVFASVASKALSAYGIEPRFVHLDSTSFHLQGQYDVETPDEETITITHGYSRDHRPDLKQIVAQLISSHKSNLPIWLEVLSGNSSDKESFIQTVKAYCQNLKDKRQPYFVMDSAGYSENSLNTFQDILWLMRVPKTLVEAMRLVKETEKPEMTELTAGNFSKEITSEYGGVNQRGLIVFFQAEFDRELKSLAKSQTRGQEAAEKQWRKVCRPVFNCQEDAEAAFQQFNQRL